MERRDDTGAWNLSRRSVRAVLVIIAWFAFGAALTAIFDLFNLWWPNLAWKVAAAIVAWFVLIVFVRWVAKPPRG